MRKTFIVLAFILVQGVPGHLFAQGDFGFEIGAFGGYGIWKDRDFQIGPPQVPTGSSNINLNFAYKDEFVYGGRFNLLSRGHWGGEISYSYQNNTLAFSRQAFPGSPVTLDGAIHHLFYNTIFYPVRYQDSKVMPFATGGIGLAAYSLSDEARARAADPTIYGIGNLRPSEKRFAYNYGFGVKAKVTSRIGVRADFRHIFSDVPSYGLPKESSNPAQTVLPIQGKLQMYEASAGIYFHISKGL
ncbi:MAG: outer membrane beta-barrel protein [Acidobacteria bacterium]|nr:outer membrane beta-barrel protein [Acidobacteriota bacterium]MCI0626068.1 outer membrane beta-barrel protein [Acidobacteriota bacterium]MCI0717406.1 outer membrane beta-barrel protein [Acidobacteriota bacterium]